MGVEVRIFSPPGRRRPEFIQKVITQKTGDIRLVERLYQPGNFELNMPLAHRAVDRIEIGDFVRIDGYFWGVIEDVQELESVGERRLILSGSDLKGLTLRRGTIPPDTPDSELVGTQGYDVVKGTTEHCIKHYVEANMIGDGKRGIPGLVIAPDQSRGVAEDKYMSRHDNLGEVVLKELAEAAGLGYDIVPDLMAGTMIFDVIEGTDRSGEQQDRPPVIFEPPRKSATASDYKHGTRDSKNVLYVTKSGAQYADEALTMAYYREDEADEAVGLDRREVFLTISADTPEPGEEYNELERLALIRAEDYRPTESFSCDISESRYFYREHYWLGDKVTARNSSRTVTMHAPIIEVQTDYSMSGIKRKATFGTAPLNVFGRIRRQIQTRS